ncbi:MAG: hypothetical protein LBI37_00115 [Puniceicoccales bacterium]|jgi:hypothetical protein|nr:hypothetical protein [Puniceicoccales bacterium]
MGCVGFGDRLLTPDREALARIDQARKANGAGAGWAVAWRVALKPMSIDIRDRRIKEKECPNNGTSLGQLNAKAVSVSDVYVKHTNLPTLKGSTIDDSSKQSLLECRIKSDEIEDAKLGAQSKVGGAISDLAITLIRDNPASCVIRIICNLAASIIHAASGISINIGSKSIDAIRLSNNNITNDSAQMIAHIKNQGEIDKHAAVNCLLDAGLAVVDLIKFPLSLLKGIATTIGYGITQVVDKFKNTPNINVIANAQDLPPQGLQPSVTT